MRNYGKLINEQYYRLLKVNPKLSLYDCIALDSIQKHEVIEKEMAARLKKLHLIEGRYPKLHLSEYVAKTTDSKKMKTEYTLVGGIIILKLFDLLRHMLRKRSNEMPFLVE